MTTTKTATSPRFLHLFALVALGVVGAAAGCGMEELEEQQDQIASEDSALIKGGGPRGQSFTCSNGTCTCDKSIENDCADMSGVCTDGTVDALISCINGWLTTHCTCTLARVAPRPGTNISTTTAVKSAVKAR